MSLKTVTSKIKSVDKTRQVTKAMEAVSAVKMRKSQENAFKARPYARTALQILSNVSKSSDISSHPLGEERPVKKSCFIVITSDRGLAGSLNSSVLKKVTRTMEERNLKKEDIGIISIGSRGAGFFLKREFTILENYEKWGDLVSFDDIAPLITRIQSLFTSGKYDDVWIFYTNFITTLQQEVFARRVLPITTDGVREVVAGIVPEKGMYSEINKDEEVAKTDKADAPDKSTQVPLEESRPGATEGVPIRKLESSSPSSLTGQEYIFEPSAEKVLETLLPTLLKIHVYHSVLEANASEHSARMVAMKSASENAEDMLRDLKLSYNKVRQAAITTEMSEIIGGVESLK